MTQKESEETLNSKAEPETAEVKEEDVEGLKQALAEEKKKAEDYLASWQRAQADFINYKRRAEQERLDFNRFANANLILSLLPVLDDLELALSSMPNKSVKNSWVEGVKLVERKFKSALEAQGVTPIKALGEPFDPNFHEAVRQEKGKDGLVVEVLQKGYLLGDRVLRPSKVAVGSGEEVAEAVENKEA